jgi:predicted  nucleic acid-binding Zn-ribbon protein
MKESRASLEKEIRILEDLEPQASSRLKETKRAYQEARKEYLAAKAELESIRGCAKEFAWLLEHSSSLAS